METMDERNWARNRTAAREHARAGQTIILVALLMVVLCGAGALAVDVGVTAQKDHFAQDAAANAANAGAHFLYGHQLRNDVTTKKYADVWNTLVDTLAANGLTVQSSSPSSVDPCSAGYAANQVALNVQLLDALNATSAWPGNLNTSLPSTAWGVRVSLRTCQQAAFGGVLGHPRYTISVDASAGRPAVNPTPTPNGIPTDTPTSTPTSTATNTPTSTPTATNTPTVTPTPCSGAACAGVFSVAPFVVYAPTTYNPAHVLYAVGSSGRPSGDVVTLFGNGGGWQNNQYTTPSQGQSGTVGSASVHDDSFEGCLDPSNPTVTVNGLAAFNHGGVGHCGSAPAPGSIVTIPIIDQAYKNEAPCTSMGGYCVHVVGVIRVQISTDPSKDSVPGVIQATVLGTNGPGSDPYNVVDPPVATPTPTSTPTSTPTNTPTATPTNTPMPTAFVGNT